MISPLAQILPTDAPNTGALPTTWTPSAVLMVASGVVYLITAVLIPSVIKALGKADAAKAQADELSKQMQGVQTHIAALQMNATPPAIAMPPVLVPNLDLAQLTAPQQATGKDGAPA